MFDSKILHVILLAVLLPSHIGAARSQVVTSAPQSKGLTKPEPSFEVVSIRKSAAAPPYSQYVSNPPHQATFDVTDIWMSQIIAGAYDVNFRTQLSGGPEWMGHQRFTIHARSGPEANSLLAAMTDDQANEAKRAMLRTMLVERFGLKIHFETREATVYTLTFAKPSPNLKESASEVLSEDQLGLRSLGDAQHIKMVARQVSMGKLANMLGFYLQNEVLDQTGLTKLYDFTVTFDPHPDVQSDDPNAAAPAEVAFPKQLGLKLTRGKAPVKILVVDALTMPTSN